MGNSLQIGIIVGIYFVAMIGMGFYFNKKQSGSIGDYFIGKDTGIGPYVLAFSYMATAISAGTFMGEVGQAYSLGYTMFYIALMSLLGSVLNYLVLGKRCYVLGKRLDIITAGDLLSYRFYSPKAIRSVQAVVLLICITAAMVAQFIAAGIIFNVVFGIPTYWGAILGAICAGIYVTVGGFLAVAWTDLIQGCIMIAGAFSVLVGCFIKFGGLGGLNLALQAQNPDLVSAVGATSTTNVVLWIFIFAIGHFGYVPSFSRFFSMRSRKMLKTSVVMVALANMGFHIFGKLSGLYGVAFMDPLENPDALLPTMAIETLPAIFTGLLLAAILGASMSSIDSLVLLLSGVVVRDVFEKVAEKQLDDKKMLLVSRVVTAVLTVVGLIFAIKPPAAIMWVSTFAWGGITSTFAAPMITGLYWKRATKQGALVGMIGGFGISMLWYLLKHPFGIHGLVLGYIVNFALNIIVSLCTPKPPEEVIKNCFPSKEEMAAIT